MLCWKLLQLPGSCQSRGHFSSTNNFLRFWSHEMNMDTFQKQLLLEQIFSLLRIYFRDCFFHNDP